MRRDELRVEQPEAAEPQPHDEWTSATFEASRARWNMLSPKKAAPRLTP